MKKLMTIIIISILLLSGCNNDVKEKDELIVYSPYPMKFIQPIIQKFEQSTVQRVIIIHDSTRKLISKIEKTDVTQRGDVFIGGSLTELKNEKSIFSSPIHPFILMPLVIVTNQQIIGNIDIHSYKDLADTDIFRHFVYSDPVLTNTGHQHRQAIYNLYGRDFTDKILARGIKVKATDNVLEYVVNGKAYAGLTYEFQAMDYIDKGYPLQMVYPNDGTMINIDGIAAIQKRHPHTKQQELINYLQSKEVQQYISENFHLKSIRKDVKFKPYKQNKSLKDIKTAEEGLYVQP